MHLSELLKILPEAKVEGKIDLEISNLAYDSRKVKEDGLFVAISGHRTDGHRFIDQAIRNGSKAVVVEKEGWVISPGVTQISVENSRQALSRLAVCFFGHPALKLHLIGITGTNGKTTTSYLVESILKAAGFSVGVLGTICYRYGSNTLIAPVTTPESLDLQGFLADMVQENISHLVMEVSSHALDQGRLGNLYFEQGIFTNLSQDHLDYHRDMEDYFQAKAKLFHRHLKGPRPGLGIINQDDPYGQRLWREWSGPKQDFGIEKKAAYFPLEIHSDLDGIRGTIQTPRGNFSLRSPLIGRYNMYNILAAWAVGEGYLLEGAVIQKGIEALTRVPGRMEKVPNRIGLTILVDYSHTPEALRFALLSLRGYSSGKIITVFGCGGDRDPYKRPIMGRVAGELSHLTMVTSDNPRSEDPYKIIQDVEKGLIDKRIPFIDRKDLNKIPTSPGYALIPDRREAIALAVRLAQPRDIILIAGKGHETYQIVGSKVLDFDDREEARKALEGIDVQYR
ncbi:MAG: UDP-N-acetylmuramoyl-L-alanyl-D-glutamate--2,6-diaminopimelate ligase [Thermodesulfobacteriota bacterium]